MANLTAEEKKVIQAVMEAFADVDAVAEHFGIHRDHAIELLESIHRKLGG